MRARKGLTLGVIVITGVVLVTAAALIAGWQQMRTRAAHQELGRIQVLDGDPDERYRQEFAGWQGTARKRLSERVDQEDERGPIRCRVARPFDDDTIEISLVNVD